MVSKIWLKLPGEKPYQVKPDAIRFGNDVYIRLEGNGRDVELGGSPKTFIPFLRGLLEAIESKSDYAEPAPEVTIDDIGPEPPARPINPGIILDDLNTDPAHDWPLIAARFPWLADTVPARYLKVRPQVDEIGQAVAKLLPHRAELLDEAGQPKHGAKTQVASIMKFKQTGGGFARKIDLYLEALAEAA